MCASPPNLLLSLFGTVIPGVWRIIPDLSNQLSLIPTQCPGANVVAKNCGPPEKIFVEPKAINKLTASEKQNSVAGVDCGTIMDIPIRSMHPSLPLLQGFDDEKPFERNRSWSGIAY